MSHDYSNFEVIIVDNASTDGSVEAIRSDYPQVTLFENSNNCGFAGGNNVAMRFAAQEGADYVWLLNNDATVEKDTLTRLVMTAENSQNIGLVSPIIYHFDDRNKIQSCGGYIDWQQHEYGIILSPESWQDYSTQDHISLYLWGTALLIKRSVIDKIGYFDEKYFAYTEDRAYCVKAEKAGYRSVIDPNARAFHKWAASTGNNHQSPLKIFLTFRNNYFFWMDNLNRMNKLRFFGKYLLRSIDYTLLLSSRNLPDAAEACREATWCAIRRHGGSRTKGVKIPAIIRSVFFSHPYYWRRLLMSNFLGIVFKYLKRSKSGIFRTRC